MMWRQKSKDDHADIIEWKLVDGWEMGMFSSHPQQDLVLVYLKLTRSLGKHFREGFHHRQPKVPPSNRRRSAT